MHIEAASPDMLSQAVAMVEEMIRVTSWTPKTTLRQGMFFAYQHKIWLDMEADWQSCDSLNAHLLGKSGQNFRQIHETWVALGINS